MRVQRAVTGFGQTILAMLRRAAAQKRRKYNNKPTFVGGHHFDSKAEMRRYLQLERLKAAGEIEQLQVHPKFHFSELRYQSGRIPSYTADFAYRVTATGEYVVEDVKGGSATITPDFKLKWALMLHFYQIRVRIVRMRGERAEWEEELKKRGAV